MVSIAYLRGASLRLCNMSKSCGPFPTTFLHHNIKQCHQKKVYNSYLGVESGAVLSQKLLRFPLMFEVLATGCAFIKII